MGKELIYKALRHEETERVPWVPFAGVHAGKLKGYTAKEILLDADKLYESLMEVHKLYTPDGMPVVFDLQIEAEILGCKLLWAENNPPSVRKHPFAATAGVPSDDKIPKITDGRIPMVLDVTKRLKESIGEDTAIYGLICGPLTLASHLRGSDFFMDMFLDPDYIKELMEFCKKVSLKMAEYYIDAGVDVVAVVDPLVSQVSPDSFEAQLSFAFSEVFDYIRERGVFSAFFVCGNATNQMKVMCDTHPDSIHVDENVDLLAAKDVTDAYNILIGGNIPLTTTMLFGNQQDNMKFIIDMLDQFKGRETNLIISPGCDMPYDVPIENTVAVAQAIFHPDDCRKFVENYSCGGFEDIEIEIPDYENLEKPLVELFTLDPDQCAACTYMVRSVTDIYDEIKDMADYVVYRYNIKEDIARTQKMGLSNLPTMCINGKPKFISIIPSKDELIEAIKEEMK
ncbi:MAG: uroporphyrinogen decarboxylase family protein [Lachnospiraceae bacterium]|nr:uroporphyrinogen decarboxylase family protein [Lachnospiraceae bacterium]